MEINNRSVLVTYSDSELHSLIEEYITQQRSEFTLDGACSYILYWAVEDKKIADAQSLIEVNVLHQIDQDRVRHCLQSIILDGRIEERENGNKNIFIKLNQ